jgi:hypothetical protein
MKGNESIASPEPSQYRPKIADSCSDLVLKLAQRESDLEPGEIDGNPLAMMAEISSGGVSYSAESDPPHWEWTLGGEERETKKRLSELVLQCVNEKSPEELTLQEREWVTAVNQAIAAINTIEILRGEVLGNRKIAQQ